MPTRDVRRSPRTVRSIVRAASTNGWVTAVTYARGTMTDQHGAPTRVVDSVVLPDDSRPDLSRRCLGGRWVPGRVGQRPDFRFGQRPVDDPCESSRPGGVGEATSQRGGVMTEQMTDTRCGLCPGRGLHPVDLRDGGTIIFLCPSCSDHAVALGAVVVDLS